MKFRHFYLFLIAVTAIPSCKKMEEFSVVPEITYKSIYTTRNSLGFDNKVTVVISFTDGDGDIGYRDQGNNDSIFDDPDSPYYNNYVATYFILKNGNWEDSLVYLRDTILPPKSPIGGRLPYLTPLEKIKH